MIVEKYIKEEKRLNNALNGRLENITNDIKEVLKKYNIESMPELSYDIFCLALETLHIDKFDIVGLVGYKQPPKSKEERLQNVYNAGILDELDIEKRDIIQTILDEYKTEDFSKLKDITVFNLPVFKEKGYTPMKILKSVFGGNKQNFIDLMKQIEEELY